MVHITYYISITFLITTLLQVRSDGKSANGQYLHNILKSDRKKNIKGVVYGAM